MLYEGFNLVIMYFRVTRKRIFRFTMEENRIIAFCHIGIYHHADVSASVNLYLSRINLSFKRPQFANHGVQSTRFTRPYIDRKRLSR